MSDLKELLKTVVNNVNDILKRNGKNYQFYVVACCDICGEKMETCEDCGEKICICCQNDYMVDREGIYICGTCNEKYKSEPKNKFR